MLDPLAFESQEKPLFKKNYKLLGIKKRIIWRTIYPNTKFFSIPIFRSHNIPVFWKR
jgi:hypothetical protein